MTAFAGPKPQREMMVCYSAQPKTRKRQTTPLLCFCASSALCEFFRTPGFFSGCGSRISCFAKRRYNRPRKVFLVRDAGWLALKSSEHWDVLCFWHAQIGQFLRHHCYAGLVAKWFLCMNLEHKGDFCKTSQRVTFFLPKSAAVQFHTSILYFLLKLEIIQLKLSLFAKHWFLQILTCSCFFRSCCCQAQSWPVNGFSSLFTVYLEDWKIPTNVLRADWSLPDRKSLTGLQPQNTVESEKYLEEKNQSADRTHVL